jgi:hypothetical protein
MNKLNTLIVLTVLIFSVSAVSASVLCCDWYSWANGGQGGCVGACFDLSGNTDTNKECTQTVFTTGQEACECQTPPPEGCQLINDECTGTCQSGACVDIDNECTCPQNCGLVKEEATFRVTNDFIDGPSCDGYCPNDEDCVLSEAAGIAPSCYCKPPVNVPEFATGLVALAVMLLSPAFAYLVVRKRH